MKTNGRAVGLLPAAIFPLLAVAHVLPAAPELDCGNHRICFADADRGFCPTAIVEKATGTRFLSTVKGAAGFWTLRFIGVTNDQSVAAQEKTWTRSGDSVVFRWKGIDLPGEPGVLDVEARVRYDAAEDLVRWTLQVANRSRKTALVDTVYPVFREITPPKTADVFMPANCLGGMVFRKHNPASNIYSNPNVPGQHAPVFAWHLGDTGLYIAAHDGECRMKQLNVVFDEERLSFTTVMENAGVVGKAAGTPGYDVVTRIYKGDWWEAARTYRKFALKQKWARKGKIVDRADYPRSFAERDLWFLRWHDGTSMKAALMKAAETWPGINLATEITFWSQCDMFDCNYPDMFPAKIGWPAAIKEVIEKTGQLVMPYMNGHLYSMDISGWEFFGSRIATKGSDGKPHQAWKVGKKGVDERTFARVCPSCVKEWGHIMSNCCARLTGDRPDCMRGVCANCVYLDQVTYSGACACYDKGHGHPLGGGRWYFDGYREIYSPIHDMLSKRDIAMTSEGCCDALLDCFDGYELALPWDPIDVPFYPMVYSGYASYFGCKMDMRTPDDMFFAAEARAVMFGVVPGWMTQVLLEKKNEGKARILHRVAKFRNMNHDIFVYGSMEDELRFVGRPKEMQLKWWHLFPQERVAQSPVMMGTVWKNARGTQDALAIVNLSTNAVTETVKLPCAKAFAVTCRDGEAAVKQSGATAAITLGPQAMIMLKD